MSRNLIRRVETWHPVLDSVLRARLMHEDLVNYLRDDIQPLMQPDGSYVHTDPTGEHALDHPQVRPRARSATQRTRTEA